MITIYKTKTGDSAIYCSWPLLFSLESSYIFPLCLDLIEDLHPFHTLIQWIQIPDTTWSSHSSRVVHLFHIVCSFMQSFCQPLVQIHFPCTFINNKWNITFSLLRQVYNIANIHWSMVCFHSSLCLAWMAQFLTAVQEGGMNVRSALYLSLNCTDVLAIGEGFRRHHVWFMGMNKRYRGIACPVHELGGAVIGKTLCKQKFR